MIPEEQMISRAMQIENGVPAHAEKLKDVATAFLVLALAGTLFGLLFNHESGLSYSIGYNLFGAERILAGEVPYRDFHTLYPPAIIYLNAAIFKLMGISLYNAMLGVALFKTLTTLMIYLSARQIMSRSWAFSAALYSLIWLRPNGPFKAVPMHYGELFLALGLYLLIRFLRDHKGAYLFATGVALGALALFKHNIGGYALIGSIAVVLFDTEETGLNLRRAIKNYRRALVLSAGFAVLIIPALIFMKTQGALGAMAKTLLFGPGEFLVSRLAGLPSPLVPLMFVLLLATCVWAAYKFRYREEASLIWASIVALVIISLLVLDQDLIDGLIFYAPMIVIAAGITGFILGSKIGVTDRSVLLAVTVAAAAAFMESFPRFAREQAVGAMPFVVLLLLYFHYIFRSSIPEFFGGAKRAGFVLSVLPMIFWLMGARLFFNTYFDDHLRFKSNTELTVARGRGVYFPEDKASEIDSAVNYIQQQVAPDGYFFAQSYAGSSLLFLADRNNPSGAQFWGGVGVSDTERAETLRSVQEKDVCLIVTSRKDMDAEKYPPMRNYISENFTLSKEFGEMLIFERK